MRSLLGLLLVGFLLLPWQALASGTEARREYIAHNYDAAFRLAQSAAEQGDSKAMLVLGLLYYEGKAVARDYTAALKYWRTSAGLGNSRAQNNIGTLYLHGFGVKKDYAEAVRWLQLSASHNDAYAYGNLGWIYERGLGVIIDYQKTLELYEKSASLFKEELLADPENKETITLKLAHVSRKIEKLKGVLAKPTPLPSLSTPQSSGGHQTTPQ